MNAPDDNDRKLERFIDRAVRDLPPRPAPRGLEQRVRAEIARRAALPWWRKSFAHWPPAARAGFVAISLALVLAVLSGPTWAATGFDAGALRTLFPQLFAWLESGRTLVHAVTGFFEIVLRNIPPLWLYGTLAFFATMYVALFGLGAAAYKALHAER